MKKTIKQTLFAAVALVSAGITVQAAQINGFITLRGGVELNSDSVVTATQVTGWLDQAGAAPRIVSRGGDFVTYVNVGDTVAMTAPWNFTSGPLSPLWSVGGFTYNLTESHIVFQGNGNVNVQGTGTITGNGFDPTPGVWSFSSQDPNAGGVFSFSASDGAQPCTGSIGDFVWNDLNGDGCQDPGEPGIPGVTVDLYAGPCGNATFVTSTMTDSNGHYIFNGLCDGNYSVHFHTPNGYTHTLANQSCNVGGQPSDETDSDCACTGTGDCDVCVTLPNASHPNSVDNSIDCGYVSPPMALPCPAGLFLGGKTTPGGNPGDISIIFDQFPAPNDNSYGTNSIGWGTKGHQFKDLTGSDKAGFQIINPTGTVKVSFNVDYITSSTLGSPPSCYKSLGPFGGDGSIVTNSTPPLTSDGTTIQWDTSMARDLNGPQSPFGTYSSPTYFMGCVQTIGTTGTNSAALLTNSPPVDCSLATDPSTCISTFGTPNGSQYPLAAPNPWSASYNNSEYGVVPIGSTQFENAIARHVNGWNFHDTYFVTFKQSYLTAIGFDFNNYAIASYDSATNTYTCPANKWCVAPNPTALHNSPPKDCPIPATVVVTSKTLSSKNVVITFQNNTTTGQVLTGLSITWPQATDGNLKQIKMGGTLIYNTSTGGGSLTTSSLLGTTAQRTINAGSHQNLTFIFTNNVDTNASHYTGSATFNPFGNVTMLP